MFSSREIWFGTEFCILSWQEKGLREDVECFESMSVLHPNDVFVQSVLAG